MNPFGLFRNVIGRHASTTGVKSMLAKAPSTVMDGAILGAAAAGSSIAVHKVKEALEGEDKPVHNPALIGGMFDTRNYGLVNLDTRSDMGQTPTHVNHQRPLLVTIVIVAAIILTIYAALRIWYCIPWYICKKSPPNSVQRPPNHPRTKGPEISNLTHGFKFKNSTLPAIPEFQCTVVNQKVPSILPMSKEETQYENYSVISGHRAQDELAYSVTDSVMCHSPTVDKKMAKLDQAIKDIKAAAK